MRIHIGYVRLRPDETQHTGVFTIEMDVTPNDTVLSLKERILELEGIPVNTQTLFWNRQALRNEQTLVDCNVTEGARILLSLIRSNPPPS
jgi:hypothetical protein